MTDLLEKRIINDPIIKEEISNLGVKEDEQNIISFIKKKSMEPKFSDKSTFIENIVSQIHGEVDRANVFLSMFYIFCLTNDNEEPDDEFISKFIKELKETASFGRYSNKISQLANRFKPSNQNEEEQLKLLKQKLLKYGITQNGGRLKNKKSRKGKRKGKGKTFRKIRSKLSSGKKTRKNMKGGMPVMLLLGLGAAMLAAAGAVSAPPTPGILSKGKAVAEIADKAVGLYMGDPGDGYRGLQDLDSALQTGLQTGVFNRPEDIQLGKNVHRAALAQKLGKTIGIKVFSDETLANKLENAQEPPNVQARLGKQFIAKGLRNQARRAEALKTPQEMGIFATPESNFLPYDAVNDAF